jgi:hypothetical protein
MWRPEGAKSWNDVLVWLHGLVEDAISLVCNEGVPKFSPSGRLGFAHSQEFYLVKRGHAENDAEAELIVALTVMVLLVEFLEAFPPLLVNSQGKRLEPEWPLLCHRDQLENCYFDWPLKGNSSFQGFFEIRENKRFDLEELLVRFVFIEPYLGSVSRRNGDYDYLVNGLGLAEEFAKAACKRATELAGFSLFWESLPEGEDLRDFVTCLKANDVFSTSLDVLFGVARPPSASNPEKSPATRVGRPRQRDDAAKNYIKLYPDGHEAMGHSWKDVVRALSKIDGRNVSLATIRRGLLEATSTKGEEPRQN